MSYLAGYTGSSPRPAGRSCSRARFATRMTVGTTSQRWARADGSGSSARPTARLQSAATAIFCGSLRRPSYLLAGLLVAIVAVIGAWNAYDYPSIFGFDAAEHQAYADSLIHHWHIPGNETRSEYYTPPGFYLLAGVATVI